MCSNTPSCAGQNHRKQRIPAEWEVAAAGIRELVERDGFSSSRPNATLRRVSLRGEVHLPDSRMRQQLLPVLPEQLLPHLRLELDLYCLKVLHPTLRRDEGVV